jgi:hypothetical protein
MSRKAQWWDKDARNKHDLAFQWRQQVAMDTATLRTDTRLFVQLVSNFNPTGNEEFDYAVRSAFPNKIRDSIVSAGCDTAVSLISQARTAPQYLTTAAEWATSRIAERKSRVIQGQFYDLGVFQLAARAFRAACEGGTGYIAGCVGPDGMPRIERCLHNEVYVDPEDGRYGNPRRMGRIKFVPRDELMGEYKGDSAALAAIRSAKGPTNRDHLDFFLRVKGQADVVAVFECWSLPTVDGGDDGLYLKCISNYTLVEKKHKKRRHRIVRFVGWLRDQGYYGQSLTERMLGAQLRLCEIDDYVAASQRLGSNAKTIVWRNSGVNADDVTNAACQVLEVNEGSTPPQLLVSSATPPDLADQRREIKQDAYDAQGFGDNTVTGDVNKGLSSGRAVQVADDVKVRRFIEAARLLEGDASQAATTGYMGLVKLIEDLNDDCADLDPEYAPKARYKSGRRTWLKTSKWADLQKLSENDATCQLFPISAQATTAASKYETVDNWIARGFVSKPMAMDLLGFPDVEAFEQTDNADLDLTMEQIDNLIDVEDAREDMLLPMPEQDLDLAAYWVSKAMKVAYRLAAPDEVIARFDRYLAYVRELKPPPAPQPLAPAALDPMAAAAAAAAAPVSPGPVGLA